MTSGAQRLRASIGRFRHRPPPTPQPVQLSPTTPLEALILERIAALQADVASLQDQQRWLMRLTAGAIIGAILNTLLS